MSSYRRLLDSGELIRRAEAAQSLLSPCRLCPRICKVDRLSGDIGFCRTANQAIVASFGPHFGEEEPLVGYGGSGTIFFAWCNLGCVFCQNWEISHLGEGQPVGPEELAEIMLSLEAHGCHNINFVTPSHVVPMILEALVIAAQRGLSVPLVYNTGGYDSLETLKLLEDVFDIYMPDFKYWDEKIALKFSLAPQYPQRAREAIKEMHRQVGDLVLDHRGIAVRGLLIRHLVLPGGLAGSREIFRWIAKEFSPNTYVNIMDQYRPCGEAFRYPPLNRRITAEEYLEAIRAAEEAGLRRLDSRVKARIARWF
ncbi:radical SAM protein [Thermosulfuriphilus sp.]